MTVIKHFQEAHYLPRIGKLPPFHLSSLVRASPGCDSCNILVYLCWSLGFEKGIYLLNKCLSRFCTLDSSRFTYVSRY